MWEATRWHDFAIRSGEFQAISALAKPLAHKSWRQLHRQPDRQSGRQTGSQKNRQSDRPTGYAFTERTIASRHGPRVINLSLEAAEADAALNCLSSTTKLRKVCRGRAIRRRRGRWGGYGRTRCSASCSDKVQSGFNVGPFVFILD